VIRITTRATSGIPAVFAGSLSLQEDQTASPTAALNREPGSNSDMEAYLRFVLKVAPAKGAVDFLCATTAAANMSAGYNNWTAVGVDGYCADVNSTLTQTYRFRPFMNKHGTDSFAFALRGTGVYNTTAEAEADAKLVNISITPVNDAPEIGEAEVVHAGYYAYRGTESVWVDPLDPNVTQYNFSIVTLNATSVDGELRLVANFSQNPKLGRVFTRVGAGGQPEDEYTAGSLLNMTMIDPSAANGSTTFGRAWWMLLATS